MKRSTLAASFATVLCRKTFKSNKFVLELAESYKFISDTQIDFKIRKGVKFYDGALLTADDVVTLNLVSRRDFLRATPL
ncbi:ABC transporter substrate-binding protein [Bradyrhizobium neotropicale]|uniref:Solute-binding protein family 5 domain-containing protein n=1 Tax=Bradyrhizobium neotropicale TaxID=1497615 RepID=A0A176YZM0_9BRAD|nr:ABC transporter substrate-binding protein [Bradyrhizobium neotropicale]OAF12349.1 hypothetical protein AXW67_20230 [Bradyrhizobium neotropicale]